MAAGLEMEEEEKEVGEDGRGRTSGERGKEDS